MPSKTTGKASKIEIVSIKGQKYYIADKYIVIPVSSLDTRLLSISAKESTGKNTGKNLEFKYCGNVKALKNPTLFSKLKKDDRKFKSLKIQFLDKPTPFGAQKNVWAQGTKEEKISYQMAIGSTGFEADASDKSLAERLTDMDFLALHKFDNFMIKWCKKNVSKLDLDPTTNFKGHEPNGGKFGKYKRIIRWSGKYDKKTREFTETPYGPTISTKLPSKETKTKVVNDEGEYITVDEFTHTIVVNENNVQQDFHSHVMTSLIPKFTTINVILSMNSGWASDTGVSIRLQPEQIQIIPRAEYRSSESLFATIVNDDDEEELSDSDDESVEEASASEDEDEVEDKESEDEDDVEDKESEAEEESESDEEESESEEEEKPKPKKAKKLRK